MTIALGAFLLHCSGKLSARELSNALAEHYEDWFDVDGGEVVNEEPPAEDTDGTPFLQSFEAPPAFGPTAMANYGQPFTISINHDAGENDITHALIHVTQANKDDQAPSFIRVPVSPATGNIVINAQINNVDKLPGNAFIFRLGLQGANGLVGNWAEWNVVLEPPLGEVPRVPMCPESGDFLSNLEGCYLHEMESSGEISIDCYTANVFLRGACATQFPLWEYNQTLDRAFRSTNIALMNVYNMSWPAGTRWQAREVYAFDEELMEYYSFPAEDCWIEVNCYDKATSIPFSSTMFNSSSYP